MLSHQHIHRESEPASHLVVLHVDHTDHRVPDPMTAEHPGMAGLVMGMPSAGTEPNTRNYGPCS